MGDGFFRYKHVVATGVAAISIANDGILHGIVFNQLATNAVTASTGLVTVYDATTTAASTDASVIAIIADTAGIPEFIYDVLFAKGLTLQVGSGVAPIDITVTYR